MIPARLAFFDAILALALVVVGIVTANFYLLAPFAGFQMFLLGFLLSFLGLLLSLVGIIATRKEERRHARPRALIGLVLSLVVFVPILIIASLGRRYPPINDITTDFENPPEFIHAIELIPNHGRNMKYDRDKYMAAQQQGYPPLPPVNAKQDTESVFATVQQVAAGIPDWQITYSDPKAMTLEGVATSHLFHFQDDFIIQVRSAGPGASLIEMRSKSRDGIGDFGMNYHRIKMFLDRVQAG